MAYQHIPNLNQWKTDTAGLRSPVNLPKLAPIDNLLARYFGAAEVGKVSILNSLQEEIAKSYPLVGPVRRPTQITDLDDVAEAVLEDKQKLPGPRRWQKERAGLPNLPRTLGNKDMIEDLLEKHRKAWSDEAKKNVIVDLNLEIGKWLGANKGVFPVMTTLQEKVRARLPKVLHTYNQVLCIAYVQDTREYKSISMGDESHMRARCAELETAIKAAINTIAGIPSGLRSDSSTLKIFMAPEFFFRGRNGAYADYVFDKILPEMNDRLKNLQADFSDWLFVFGTAVKTAGRTYFCGTCQSHVKYEGGQYHCPVCHVVAPATLVEKAEVYNVALLQKGSWNHYVAKERISGGRGAGPNVASDYVGGEVTVPTVEGKRGFFQKLSGSGKPVTVEAVWPAGSVRADPILGPSKWSDERMGGAVFTLDGLRMGVEICLDHDRKRLEHVEGTDLKILLIPSEGMSIKYNPCALGGVLFNVDGNRRGAQVWQVNPAKAIDDKGMEIKKFGGDARLLYFGPYVLP